MKMKTKTICTLGILTALYVVMNLVLRFNVFGNVTTDFSYVIFGAAMVLLGMAGTVVGVVGVAITSTLFSAWGFSISWVVMNLIVGIGCGLTFKNGKTVRNCVLAMVFVIIGIIAKTVIEYFLYGVPLAVKIPKAIICAVVDGAAMIMGILLAECTPLRRFKGFLKES